MVDPVFWAPDLGSPKSVVAQVKDYDSKTQGDAFPKGDRVSYEFPARGNRGPVTLHWYSGVERVPRPEEFEKEDPDIGAGAVVIGEKGKIAYGSQGVKLPGIRLEWDADKMRFTNNAEANACVNPPARPGWNVG